MATRSAEATIKGYYYQFDTTILELLKLEAATDSVVIEGIEDIDVSTAKETTSIQCKYLSKPNFTNSAVREPITLMLNHFVNPATRDDLQYVLYAHFENATLSTEPAIDLAKLKEILTYTEGKVKKYHHIEAGISDEQLKSFLLQFRFRYGLEFGKQQLSVLGLLKKTFKCSDVASDIYFYNNALRVVIDLAIKSDPLDRTITKANFLAAIDCRKKLFNEWFILLRGKKEYLKNASRSLKEVRATDPSKAKIILIGKDLISSSAPDLPISSFIENLIEKYYKMNSSLSSAKPLTLVLDCPAAVLRSTKEQLIERNIAFNDGYEEIKFSCSAFNAPAIVNTNKGGSKIVKSSYVIKLIGKATFSKYASEIHPPRVFVNISNQNDCEINHSDTQYFDFRYCENLRDAYQLIAN